ncbi:hypothetical protein FM037_11715 [Shewanella psychropiezotolerans]|uniref:Uncharacterized protein n=1 Tax=Shewanella psychropiezotolerans TaxID=2593655 RepID=A0ABX5WXG9_9GAMM|nr:MULTISPECIES: hypothetical protein [Shewanella]MPY26554.1 hypothetical protein [Shewanella sp. YLB-07]QDO83783.1 hypothetical protein FM037_11715 [Shewanella psychropiezotolerans]
MNNEAQIQLGKLLINQEKLLDLLAQNPSALDEYPDLQSHVIKKHPNIIAYNKMSKEQQSDFYEAFDERLAWLAFELAQDLKIDFLTQRAALLCGGNIQKVSSLTISEIGYEPLAKYLNMLSGAVQGHLEPKPSYPFLAEKGRLDHQFWKNADKAFDAFMDGYGSHYKLSLWCETNIGTRAPQSAPKFFKTFSDPRNIPEWIEYSGK